MERMTKWFRNIVFITQRRGVGVDVSVSYLGGPQFESHHRDLYCLTIFWFSSVPPDEFRHNSTTFTYIIRVTSPSQLIRRYKIVQ